MKVAGGPARTGPLPPQTPTLERAPTWRKRATSMRAAMRRFISSSFFSLSSKVEGSMLGKSLSATWEGDKGGHGRLFVKVGHLTPSHLPAHSPSEPTGSSTSMNGTSTNTRKGTRLGGGRAGVSKGGGEGALHAPRRTPHPALSLSPEHVGRRARQLLALTPAKWRGQVYVCGGGLSVGSCVRVAAPPRLPSPLTRARAWSGCAPAARAAPGAKQSSRQQPAAWCPPGGA